MTALARIHSYWQGSIVVTLMGPKQDIVDNTSPYGVKITSGYWKDIRDNGLDLPGFNKLFLGEY